MVKHGTMFLKDGSYPESANSADKRIKKLASCFFLNGEVLYKKSYHCALLRYADALEAICPMSEIHEG